MKLSKIKYSFSEAKKNVFRNGLMSFASLFTIACCLFMLGVFIIIAFNANSMTNQIKDECEIQLFIKEGTSDERVLDMGTEIRQDRNVKEAKLFSRTDAYHYMRDMFKDREEMLVGYTEEDHPFTDSYKIVLHDIKRTSDTVERLKKIADVSTVKNSQDMADKILNISSIVMNLSIVIMVILFAMAVVIISNTVKLTVFNRRREINIMKYIGATDRFIKVPFILEGFIIGLTASVVSFGVVYGAYYFAEKGMSNAKVFNETINLVSMNQMAPTIAIMFVVFGSLIGVLGSAISMRKHLQV